MPTDPRPRRRRLRRSTAALTVSAVGLTAGLTVGLTACGDDDTASTTTSTATDSGGTGATSTTTAASTEDGSTEGGSAEVGTVNANTASVEELAAAFEAAGVANAQQWAHEVEEYRPYSDDDWAMLHQELSKYNIDDETFTKITSVLTL